MAPRPARPLRIGQANIAHREAEHRLIERRMADHQLDVYLVQELLGEQYGFRKWRLLGVSNTPKVIGRISGNSADAAIIVANPDLGVLDLSGEYPEYLAVAEIGTGRDRYIFVSVYLSPNDTADEFNSKIEQLTEVVVRFQGYPIIVGGDFNSWSSSWSPRQTNARGATVDAMAIANRLQVENDPNSIPTFKNANGESWPDVTLSGGPASVINWEVLEDAIDSDHRLIQFQAGIEVPVDRKDTFLKPAYEMMNMAAFTDALAAHAVRRCPANASKDQIDQEIEDLTLAINEATKVALPRVRKTEHSWWDDELEEAKKNLSRLVRASARCHPDDRETLHRRRKEARRHMRLLLRQKKEDYRSQMRMQSFARDGPWGVVYKLAANKLRRPLPRAPLLLPDNDTQGSLMQQTLRNTLDRMLPDDSEEGETDYHRGLRDSFHRLPDTPHSFPFDAGALRKAAEKLISGKAPGPDGVLAPASHNSKRRRGQGPEQHIGPQTIDDALRNGQDARETHWSEVRRSQHRSTIREPVRIQKKSQRRRCNKGSRRLS
ncbi:hypothetical protein BC332_34613 [Capsicum chinense]|nr:hypothetical protein BC332_34613 [Capsicum chinense]